MQFEDVQQVAYGWSVRGADDGAWGFLLMWAFVVAVMLMSRKGR